MKDMGVNFVRTSHYPQDPAVIDACDRLGILDWEEVPNIKIHMYHAPLDEEENIYATRFPHGLMTNIKHQLKEMVEPDRNRPSIVSWGFADDLSSYQYPQDFVQLSDYTHWLDPARWTAGRCAHVTDIIDATTLFLNGKILGLCKPATHERAWQDFRGLVDQFRDTEELGGQFTKERFPGGYRKHPPFV